MKKTTQIALKQGLVQVRVYGEDHRWIRIQCAIEGIDQPELIHKALQAYRDRLASKSATK